MAFSKFNLYPREDQITSSYMKALDHPARLRILHQLSEKGPCRVEDLGQEHPISQGALSHHLTQLRKADLVKWEEKYPATYYSINQKAVVQAKEYLAGFFRRL